MNESRRVILPFKWWQMQDGENKNGYRAVPSFPKVMEVNQSQKMPNSFFSLDMFLLVTEKLEICNYLPSKTSAKHSSIRKPHALILTKNIGKLHKRGFVGFGVFVRHTRKPEKK